MISVTTILIIAIAVILGLASLGGGIFCIVHYARTRKVTLLVVGLVLTFIVPGVLFCVALGAFIPSTMVVYGPPPANIVYGPPPNSIP